MKKLTTADSLILINHYKNVLDSEGIPSEVRNQHVMSILGEMPFADTWPELWVKNDMDYDRAKQLIDDSIADESPASGWRCKACGEDNERQFAVCWNCGAAAT
ncbi:MAG: DUF2007 domain-containing protein [Woeseiaceae bacterium]|nr:DUF2007 domain-containing protein [Woeseiaceae bacterium]